MVAPLTPDERTLRERPHKLPPGATPLDGLPQELRELARLGRLYVNARRGAVVARIRGIAASAALAIAVALPAAAMLATAAVLAMVGLADALGVALGGQMWAGKLIVGFGLVAAAILGAWFFISRWKRACRKRTIEYYEHEHHPGSRNGHAGG